MSIISNEIKAYNMQLANTLTKIDLQDYITEFHTKFCSEYDISFMGYFMKLVEHEHEFIVEHEKLIEFGVITTSNKSNNIKRLLDQFNFKEGKDFNLLNIEQVRKKQNGVSCGTVIKKMYTLTPETFKICLMRSQNTLDYNMYFTFIEKVMKYYSDYQLELAINEKQLVIKEKELISIDNKELKNENQTLTQKMDYQTQLITSQSRDIQELLGHTKDVKASNQILVSSNEKILTQLSELHSLLYKMFSLMLTDIYCNNIKVMKVLILFVYKQKDNDKIFITFTYCQLSLLHIQIAKKFETFNVCEFVVFKPLKDNVITIQQILTKLSYSYTVNKRTNTIICELKQKKVLISLIRKLINESSINVIYQNLKKSDNLTHEKTLFDKAKEADEKFKTVFKHFTKPYVQAIIKNRYSSNDQKLYLHYIRELINNFQNGELDKYFE
jgi:hypothetical protein